MREEERVGEIVENDTITVTYIHIGFFVTHVHYILLHVSIKCLFLVLRGHSPLIVMGLRVSRFCHPTHHPIQ